MGDMVVTIRENHQRVLVQIAEAARRSGREPEAVRLVVVTKTQPLEIVRAALEAGVRILGENYPEEGVMKIQSLPVQSGVEWHMIGHVQSRKARLVVDHFALLHCPWTASNWHAVSTGSQQRPIVCCRYCWS